MKITCPKDPAHVRFTVSAHVAEEWLVDQDGNYVESRGTGDVLHEPDQYDTYTCDDCGAGAKVEG